MVMSLIFGMCMGAVIYRLFDDKEYIHGLAAIAAYSIGLIMCAKRDGLL